MPIRDYAEVCEDPHAKARDMIIETSHPVEGTIKALGIPIKLSATPGQVRTPAPLLGQHTERILSRFGYSDDEVATLRAERVVQ